MVLLIDCLKQGVPHTAESFSRYLLTREVHGAGNLPIGPRTIARDIALLRRHYGAPIVFDKRSRSYVLLDRTWAFPYLALRDDQLFATLFTAAIGEPFLPHPLRTQLAEARAVQLAAGRPESFAPALLKSLMNATGAAIAPDPEVFENVLHAWRAARLLRLYYRRASDGQTIARTVEVHALFLSDGAWYARVYCHLRQGFRSLAIHRISTAHPLDRTFTRSDDLVAELRQGNVFDYELVRHPVVRCSPAKAQLAGEREWFPGQQLVRLPDGALELRYRQAPRPQLVWWVLSYAGHLEVLAPPDLREEVRQTALALAGLHAP